MGMNYYLRPSRNPLKWFGNPFPFPSWGNTLELHIGKSSAGWCFALHIHPDIGINGLENWKPWLRRHRIEDEAGRRISYKALMDTITDRSWPTRDGRFTPEYLAQNHAIPGPNNLLRYQVDGFRCIANGHGTWDLLMGSFS